MHVLGGQVEVSKAQAILSTWIRCKLLATASAPCLLAYDHVSHLNDYGLTLLSHKQALNEMLSFISCLGPVVSSKAIEV